MNKLYDLVIIGAGSAGVACAKRAAGHGAHVAIIENWKYGGTCVNYGCVPKKVMFNASHVYGTVQEAKNFGISVDNVNFNWGTLKCYRDRYVQRLNNIYESGVDKMNIDRFHGYASFIDQETIKIAEECNGEEEARVKGKHIVIAVGGRPSPLNIPGAEHIIDSDGFFRLESQPKKVGIIGAGYIAVELAGVLHGLGSDVTVFCREDEMLEGKFDPMISSTLTEYYLASGIDIDRGCVPSNVQRHSTDQTLTLNFHDGSHRDGFDCVISAIGRLPMTKDLGLDKVCVNVGPRGHVVVDEFQNTSVSNIYALGDVCGILDLTPMAIAAGRRLADRLFNNMPQAKADYDNVPSVVFAHPTIGTYGLTEPQAVAQYGAENVKVYESDFVNLYYGTFFEGNAGDKPVTKYKLVCVGADQRVLGLHMIGMRSDEVLQGFAVAMKMGATKRDFDNCMAIHPTAAEEMVTMDPWGL